MINLKKSEWIILSGLLILSIVPSIGGLFRFLEITLGYSLEFLPENPRIQSAPIIVELHLIGSIPFCILGAFQFIQSIRRSYKKWHRISGIVIILAGITSAVTGLWMTSFYSFPLSLQGNLLYIVRNVVGLSMTISILLGVVSILKKRYSQHQAWMIRAYALGQGAGMQVLTAIPWIFISGTEPVGFTRDLLMTISWIINIVIAEWVIRNLNRLPKHHGVMAS